LIFNKIDISKMIIKRVRLFVSLLFILLVGIACQQNSDKAVVKNAEGTTKEGTSTKKNILFFGNSLTAGYGLDDASTAGFVGLTQQKIDALNLPFRCINAGLSGQ
jgi:acyl-CoA thioesterase I